MIIRIFIILFAVGLLLHLVPSLVIITSKISDLFLLLLNSSILILLLSRNTNKIFYLYLPLAYLITFSAEVMGAKTGMIFGSYEYGSTLWIQVLSVPLVIPFNWVMLVLGFTAIVQSARIPKWIVPFGASLCLVIFDFFMEPVAMELGYWEWKAGTVPFMNYIAWFVIALLLSLPAVIYKFNLQYRILKAYVIMQFLFFLVLNSVYRFN